AEVAGEAGIELKTTLSGTLAAEQHLRSGDARLAVVAMPEGSELNLPADARQIPLAYQVVIIATHANNPVESLHYDQLRNVFGSDGRVDQWGAFSTHPGWINRK